MWEISEQVRIKMDYPSAIMSNRVKMLWWLNSRFKTIFKKENLKCRNFQRFGTVLSHINLPFTFIVSKSAEKCSFHNGQCTVEQDSFCEKVVWWGLGSFKVLCYSRKSILKTETDICLYNLINNCPNILNLKIFCGLLKIYIMHTCYWEKKKNVEFSMEH